jgi:hypothetical protein
MRTANATDMVSRLPERSDAKLEGQTHFVRSHDVRGSRGFRNAYQEMRMIGHDHKTIEKKWD